MRKVKVISFKDEKDTKSRTAIVWKTEAIIFIFIYLFGTTFNILYKYYIHYSLQQQVTNQMPILYATLTIFI